MKVYWIFASSFIASLIEPFVKGAAAPRSREKWWNLRFMAPITILVRKGPPGSFSNGFYPAYHIPEI